LEKRRFIGQSMARSVIHASGISKVAVYAATNMQRRNCPDNFRNSALKPEMITAFAKAAGVSRYLPE
jgi:hypothetical protein